MGHYAIDQMNLRARETVYWPGISEDIRSTYHNCQICAKFARTQQTETLQHTGNTTNHMETTWFRHFLIKKVHNILITVDYFSWFPVVRKLQSLHSLSIMKHLKHIFTEIAIPKCIVSDGGTQFHITRGHKDFTKAWGIQHRVTSPTNAQSNSQAECFVQTIKNSLTKAMEGGKDPHLAILSYVHNTFEPQSTITSRATEL